MQDLTGSSAGDVLETLPMRIQIPDTRARHLSTRPDRLRSVPGVLGTVCHVGLPPIELQMRIATLSRTTTSDMQALEIIRQIYNSSHCGASLDFGKMGSRYRRPRGFERTTNRVTQARAMAEVAIRPMRTLASEVDLEGGTTRLAEASFEGNKVVRLALPRRWVNTCRSEYQGSRRQAGPGVAAPAGSVKLYVPLTSTVYPEYECGDADDSATGPHCQ